jgi:hypothetical protein
MGDDMANYGYVKVQKVIDPYAFIKALHEINTRRFGGLLKIEPMTDETHGWFVSFLVRVVENENGIWYVVGRHFWLSKNRKKIVQPHGCGNYLNEWVDNVFLNELGAKFSGMIEDDGCEETWKPKPKRYPTLAHYMLRLMSVPGGKKKTPEMRKIILDNFHEEMDSYLKHLPEEWHPLLGVLPKA